jgi:hypothetical protein
LNGLYRPDDAGANWKHLNNDFGLVVDLSIFLESQLIQNPEIVVKGGLSGSISRDGKTFKNLETCILISMILFLILMIVTECIALQMAVFIEVGMVQNTMEMVSNIPVSQFYHVSIDDKEPFNVYGGLQDNGSWYGPSKVRAE